MTPKEKNSTLTASWLRANMNYDAATGIFSWSKPGFGRTVGKPIGVKSHKVKNRDYVSLKVNGTIFYAHRLAWLYVYGEWPEGHVDHIDGDRANNAISNLRESTPSQNAARRQTTRMVGPSRGVFPHGAGYVARLHHGGVRHYLGYHKTAEAAKAAYEAKAQEIHGEFAHPAEASQPKMKRSGPSCCEICESTQNLRLDRTRIGSPRGMLCVSCWGALQSMGERPKDVITFARKAISYLREYRDSPSAFAEELN